MIPLSINNSLNLGYGLGAFDYLIKPVGTAKLKSFVADFETLTKRSIERILYIDNAEVPAFDLPVLAPLEIEVLRNPENAIEQILHFHPDLIIAGIFMPELDGISLVHILKSGKDTRNIPVVLSIPDKFSDKEKENLSVIIDKLMTSTRAHPLDLLKIIRDRIEIHETQIKEVNSSKGDSEGTSETSLLSEDDYIGEVMIVDDDPDTLFTLNEIVKTCKCKTVIAKSGKECLQILDYNTPGLILLDIMMPEMDGFQTLKQIKKKKKSRSIPVFAVTARAMAEDKEIILKYGFDDYISKPVNSGVIAFKIEKLFSKIKIT